MNDSKPIDRREFTLHSAMAILGGVAISVSGCDSDSPAAPTPPSSGDETGTVGTNHSHSAVITAAELAAGNMISLDIRGTATHGHTVELSADEVMQIGDGARVSKESDATNDLGEFGVHMHTVTFN